MTRHLCLHRHDTGLWLRTQPTTQRLRIRNAVARGTVLQLALRPRRRPPPRARPPSHSGERQERRGQLGARVLTKCNRSLQRGFGGQLHLRFIASRRFRVRRQLSFFIDVVRSWLQHVGAAVDVILVLGLNVLLRLQGNARHGNSVSCCTANATAAAAAHEQG